MRVGRGPPRDRRRPAPDRRPSRGHRGDQGELVEHLRGGPARAIRGATAPVRSPGRSPPTAPAGRPSGTAPRPRSPDRSAGCRSRCRAPPGAATSGRDAGRRPGPPRPPRRRSAPPRRPVGRTVRSPPRRPRRSTGAGPRPPGRDRAGPRRAPPAPRTPAGCPFARRARRAPETVATRQRLPQRPGAEPAGGLAEPVPADPVPRLQAEHPVHPGTEGVGVTTSARPRRAATCPSAQAKVVAPAPPLAPVTPTTSPGGPPTVADVGQRLGQPRLRARQLGNALGTHAQREAEQLVRHRAPRDHVHPDRRTGAIRASLLGHVHPHQDQRPTTSPAGRLRHHPRDRASPRRLPPAGAARRAGTGRG